MLLTFSVFNWLKLMTIPKYLQVDILTHVLKEKGLFKVLKCVRPYVLTVTQFFEKGEGGVLEAHYVFCLKRRATF